MTFQHQNIHTDRLPNVADCRNRIFNTTTTSINNNNKNNNRITMNVF